MSLPIAVTFADLAGAEYVAGGQLRLKSGKVVWIGDVLPLISEAAERLKWHEDRQRQEEA